MGAPLHHRQLPRPPPHLLRPPRPEPQAQSRLLGCIADLIDNRHGGEIINRYLTELRVAPAVQPPT
ncbi:MAG TPA: hypothetical protein VHM23_05430 [Actinomycetota bacterium]|nr:hypothetical protein [Actinomycetota bacterium]